MKNFFAVALLLLLTACAHHGTRYWRPNFPVHRDTFANGLTVLFVEDHTTPVVSYATWFKVGSAWEKPGSTGIAHLFEHMMFKGTPRFPAKKFFENLESKGAIVNAFTERGQTVYYEVIGSQYLERVIDMEADRLANLMLTQSDLDSERQVVKEERRLRVDSNFGAQELEALQKLAFPTHPYGWPVIGYQEDLDRLSLDEAKEFFHKYYQPGNAIITIAGDFDYSEAKKLIERYYGPIQGKKVPELKVGDYKPEGREKRATIFKPVEASTLMIGYYIPSMYSKDADALAMLGWSLFGMGSSRAPVELVRQRQLALAVSGEADLERFPFLFMITADVKTSQSTEPVEKAIYDLLDDAKKNPLTEAELERVKNGLLYNMINEGKSPGGMAGWLASGEFNFGDWEHTFKTIDHYNAMTPKDLMEVARKYFSPENRVVVVMKPEDAK